MDNTFFLTGLRKVIMNPDGMWKEIKPGKGPVRPVVISYLLPLILLVSVAGFVGSLLFINAEHDAGYSFLVALRCFFVFFFSIYVTAVVVKEITYPLDLGRDFNLAFRLVAYSFTPLLLCQILSRMFESVLFVNIIALYGLYIFWTGAERLLDPPQHKKMPLVIASFITSVAVFGITEYAVTKITDKIYYLIF